MTLVTLFVLIGSLYLVVIAYGVVRTRKRGLPPGLRLSAAAVQVIVLPAVLLVALLLTGSAAMIGAWGPVIAMLALAGTFLAICTDIVAKRVL